MFKKAVSFFKENTLRAVFEAVVAIVIVAVFGLIRSVRESVFNFLLFIIRKEYFYICAFFAGAYLLLYRRVKNLENRFSEKPPVLDDKGALSRGFEYFFSENANWKIDLARRSFNRNPHCACCDPPSALLALGASMLGIDLFSTSDTHRCAKTDKKYSIEDNAYLIAYQRAKKEYEVNNPDLEEELEKIKRKKLQVP